MATTPAAAPAGADFETNLLDACDDMSVCAKGFFCPCILVGEIHERMGQEFGAFCCLNFFGNNIGLSCARRGVIRAAYNLPESPCGDCLAVTCCGPCATIQEYHQVNKKVFPLRPDMNQWNTGLFDCAEDGYMCTKGCICPCMLSADTLNYLGAPWFCMCMCPIGCAARTLIRQTYNIDGTFCKDILTSAHPPLRLPPAPTVVTTLPLHFLCRILTCLAVTSYAAPAPHARKRGL
jgi:Cys-rich protein (TIGR01571 family)